MKRFYTFSAILIALNCFVPLASAQFVEWDPVLDRELNIPDPNLRAAIEDLLDGSITPRSMERIIYFKSKGRSANIRDLTGLEWAVNLQQLDLYGNRISDISPLTGLIKLEILNLRRNQISDISPLTGLGNLQYLYISSNQISDISPLTGLTNLKDLIMDNNKISDISPLTGLINLENLYLSSNRISNLSPLKGLINLRNLFLIRNRISDISPLTGLINLTILQLGFNRISDLSPLTGLINIQVLFLRDNNISDIAPLLKLKNPTYRYSVHLGTNQISDRDMLLKLKGHATPYFSGNPAFDAFNTPGPKIEGPWLWLVVPTGLGYPNRVVASGTDFLSEVSGGSVTEADIASNGATAGTVVGNSQWTHGSLVPTADDNLTQLTSAFRLTPSSGVSVIYGVISVKSPKAQETRLYIGTSHPAKVWLNGELVHVDLHGHFDPPDYKTAFPVKLQAGENRLLVANYWYIGYDWHVFYGFEEGTDYTVPGSPQMPIANGDKITGEETLETSVVVDAAELPSMFWVDSEAGTLHSLIDAQVQHLLPNVQDATNLAVDVSSGKLYWTEKSSNTTGKIRRANLDGSNVALVKELTSVPLEIALDTANRKIYLTNVWGKIQRMNLNGTNFQPNLITDLEMPQHLTLDVARGKIYWTEQTGKNTGKIRRADISGSNVELVKMLPSLPFGMAADVVKRKLYVSTADKIQHLSFDGSDFRPNFIRDLESPMALAVDAMDGKVYWTEMDKLRRADLNGGNIEDVVRGLSGMLSGITLEIEAVQPTPTPPPPEKPAVVIAEAQPSPLYWLDTQAGSLHRLIGDKIEDLAPSVRNATSLAVDVAGGKLYWTEKTSETTGKIRCADLDGSNVRLIKDLTSVPHSMAVDAVDGKIYLTNAWGKVQRLNVDGSNFEPNLITGLDMPKRLALDVLGGKVYWAEMSGGIRRANLDGSKVEDVANGLGTPMNIAISGDMIYWTVKTGEDTGEIRSANLRGTPTVVTLNTFTQGFPMGIAVDPVAEKLYWTTSRGEIGKANIDGSDSQPNLVTGLTAPGSLAVAVKPKEILPIDAEPSKPKADVNADGVVNIQDLVLVASSLGKTGQNVADVNTDEVVDIRDLVLVAGALGNTAAAPSLHPQALMVFTATDVQQWLFQAQDIGLTDITSQRGMRFLEQLLAAMIPKETMLLANYPNPFNPETWIPYQLAIAADVQILIYDARGVLVRRLGLGYQPAGYYTSPSRAAYWNGRNNLDERVASGVYFYQLLTNEVSSLRKMVILK